jgi:transposase-like protein
MTHEDNYTFSKNFIDELIDVGFEGMPEMFKIIMNNAMKAERETYLQANKYERTEDRLGYANGYKPKTIKSRVGEVTLDIPQVREGGFYPSALEKGMRSERALLITLAEMYIQGVSTQKVSAVIEKMCGFEISAM